MEGSQTGQPPCVPEGHGWHQPFSTSTWEHLESIPENSCPYSRAETELGAVETGDPTLREEGWTPRPPQHPREAGGPFPGDTAAHFPSENSST
eukprot:14842449-Heterocapsa_arctica.AAC.1